VFGSCVYREPILCSTKAIFVVKDMYFCRAHLYKETSCTKGPDCVGYCCIVATTKSQYIHIYIDGYIYTYINIHG